MSAGFTPGPWVLWIASGEAVRVLDSRCDEEIVSYTDFPKSASMLARRKANAHLIAASPDLYEALVKAERILAEHEYVTDYAQAALAKARGEQ